jgi:hypothetical protein
MEFKIPIIDVISAVEKGHVHVFESIIHTMLSDLYLSEKKNALFCLLLSSDRNGLTYVAT